MAFPLLCSGNCASAHVFMISFDLLTAWPVLVQVFVSTSTACLYNGRAAAGKKKVGGEAVAQGETREVLLVGRDYAFVFEN